MQFQLGYCLLQLLDFCLCFLIKQEQEQEHEEEQEEQEEERRSRSRSRSRSQSRNRRRRSIVLLLLLLPLLGSDVFAALYTQESNAYVGTLPRAAPVSELTYDPLEDTKFYDRAIECTRSQASNPRLSRISESFIAAFLRFFS